MIPEPDPIFNSITACPLLSMTTTLAVRSTTSVRVLWPSPILNDTSNYSLISKRVSNISTVSLTQSVNQGRIHGLTANTYMICKS